MMRRPWPAALTPDPSPGTGEGSEGRAGHHVMRGSASRLEAGASSEKKRRWMGGEPSVGRFPSPVPGEGPGVRADRGMTPP
jgi:hypothetical protein